MGKEIERKFLVTGDFKEQATGKFEITQGYLSVDPARIVRVRITEKEAHLAIKTSASGSGFSRNEWELPVPLQSAIEIMEVCLPGKIVKTRYIVPVHGHNFEVDAFHGKNEGLIIAEIELFDEAEDFIRPEWLGDEVTGKKEYYNSNLI